MLVAAADASPAGSQPRRQVGQSMESPAGAVQPLRQLEILALFNLTASGAFSVAASVELGGGARATATLNGTAADASGGGRAVTSADLWVDTRAAGGATQGALWGGPLALPPGGVPAAGLELRVLVDHSLLEVFALGGRQRAAVRVYPLDPSASWGASMLAGDDASAAAVQAAATVWEVDGCWVDELEPS